MTLQQPSGRLARWIMELQQNYFDIQYQKETLNRGAEALSRQPVNSSANREPEIAVVGGGSGLIESSGTGMPTRRELRSRSKGMKGYSTACRIGLKNTPNTVCEGEAIPEHREIARRSYKEGWYVVVGGAQRNARRG